MVTRKLRAVSGHVEQFGCPNERIVARPRLWATTLHSWKPGSTKYSTGVRTTAFVLTRGSLQRQRFASRSVAVAPLAMWNVLPDDACVIGGRDADAAPTARIAARDSAANSGAVRVMSAFYPLGPIETGTWPPGGGPGPEPIVTIEASRP